MRYRNAMPDSADLASGQGRSWRDTLNVTDRKQAEQRLTELGYNFRWLDDGGISVQTPPLLAVDEFGRGKDVSSTKLWPLQPAGPMTRAMKSRAVLWRLQPY